MKEDDLRRNNGGHQGTGRKPKNTAGKKITFKPSDEVLEIYQSWENKTETLEAAIIAYNKKK